MVEPECNQSRSHESLCMSRKVVGVVDEPLIHSGIRAKAVS